MRIERRRNQRFPFMASAEIVDENETENSRTATQIRDLSRDGCYVEMANPFPQGTNVFIEIYTETEFMEAHATVAYREPMHGMGLSFGELQPCFAGVLNRWLIQANGANGGKAS